MCADRKRMARIRKKCDSINEPEERTASSSSSSISSSKIERKQVWDEEEEEDVSFLSPLISVPFFRKKGVFPHDEKPNLSSLFSDHTLGLLLCLTARLHCLKIKSKLLSFILSASIYSANRPCYRTGPLFVLSALYTLNPVYIPMQLRATHHHNVSRRPLTRSPLLSPSLGWSGRQAQNIDLSALGG